MTDNDFEKCNKVSMFHSVFNLKVTYEKKTKKSVKDDIKQWIESVVQKDLQGRELCAGARIVLDENDEGVFQLDPTLPLGVWIVISHDGTRVCYENVSRPVFDVEKDLVDYAFDTENIDEK